MSCRNQHPPRGTAKCPGPLLTLVPTVDPLGLLGKRLGPTTDSRHGFPPAVVSKYTLVLSSGKSISCSFSTIRNI
jgi:hypothetical protein